MARAAVQGDKKPTSKAATPAARFDALVPAWLDGLTSGNTRSAYQRDLAAFGTWCAAEGHAPLEAGAAELDRYRDACTESGAGPATVSRRLSALASFYDHAIAANAVRDNPVDNVRRPAQSASPEPSLDDAEAIDLYDAAVALGPKSAALVALLLLDGLKLGEALGLDVGDLEGSGRAMRATVVRRGEDQAVTLDRRTTRAIGRYLGNRTRGPLLLGDSPTHESGSRLTRFGADFLVKRAAEHAGLGRSVSANTLRRSYICRSHRDGTPLVDIQRHIGLATPRDTRRYLS